jgi:hypothetical protein
MLSSQGSCRPGKHLSGEAIAAKKAMLTQEEATRQVPSIVNRMALLYYSFTRTLLKELGEKGTSERRHHF